jgi:hypothetical protein
VKLTTRDGPIRPAMDLLPSQMAVATSSADCECGETGQIAACRNLGGACMTYQNGASVPPKARAL